LSGFLDRFSRRFVEGVVFAGAKLRRQDHRQIGQVLVSGTVNRGGFDFLVVFLAVAKGLIRAVRHVWSPDWGDQSLTSFG
jgi:hypothetical protein